MPDLFSPSRVKKIDPRGVHSTYDEWPRLAREGFGVNVEFSREPMKKAYVLGMGGSASGGDIIAGWLSSRHGVEMSVFKGQLPMRDMSDSIALACSSSGQTEETIEMLHTAVQRHATVLAISGGGKLKETATRLGIPHIDMPKAVAPRYMLPFIVFSTLAVVNKGLALGCEAEAEETFNEMGLEGKVVRLASPLAKNSAKGLALSLVRKTPTIYGARVTRGVGIRFKNVLNENSKKHAIFDGIPDAFHNEIEAWEDPSTAFLPVFLRHSHESERDRTREDRMVDILAKARKSPVEVRGRGRSSLSQLLTMVYRLDMTSYYTAIALGRDPFPTRLIDTLKRNS